MEGREKPHMVQYKAITNDWNYDASRTLTSLPVWDIENFKRLVFVVQSVHSHQPKKYSRIINSVQTICILKLEVRGRKIVLSVDDQ
jgi:hypothetical protein